MLFDYNINRYTISDSAKLKSALHKFDTEKIRFLMCLAQDGRLTGCLTLGDVNRWLLSEDSYSLDISVSHICNKYPRKIYGLQDHVQIEAMLRLVAYVPVLTPEDRPLALAMNRHGAQGLLIDGFNLTKESPTFVIAEIGNNHNGSLDMAKRLIDYAKKSGANSAKFQMRDLKSLYINEATDDDAKENLGSQYTLDLLKRFQLPPDELFKAFDYCKEVGLTVFCTPWDIASVQLLESYGVCAYKVSSADLTNHILLKELAKTGKPLICSTGMSLENEIVQSVQLLQNLGVNYALLHCNSTYPTPFKDVQLSYLKKLCELGDCIVGYSGHERDIFVSIAAVAKGAKIVEKHLTLNCDMEGNDHKVSLLPHEFERMVEGIRQIDQALGNGGTRELTQGEMMNRVTLAKSVFAACDIPKGQIIGLQMLKISSPGQGVQPNRINELIGKPCPRAMEAGDVFYPQDIDANDTEAQNFTFRNFWGIPVRYHDYKKLLNSSNPGLLEFHLSYKDLDLDINDFFKHQLDQHLVVHAPELFAGDHILDLASPKEKYRERSIFEMKRVIELTKKLKTFFVNSSDRIGIITNVGGFSQDAPLNEQDIAIRINILCKSLAELQDDAVEIWPQTMPPFPWHFGGQRYHNLFVKPDEIIRFCVEENLRICFDTSHSKLACNHLNYSFHKFAELVLPHTAHLHIADAKDLDSEGLQIGEGEIDFYALGRLMREKAPTASWIPEVWQGHEKNGAGFWKSLSLLQKSGEF